MTHNHMTLSECRDASTKLYGLIQAMEALDGDSSKMAQDGLGALLCVISDMSDALADSVGRLDDAADRARRAVA
jgi:hypothetical protein